MSQYSYEYVPVRESNALGMAGFICSLAGLILTGGILCPVGLILSLAALGRQPRGFAIAGVILGLVGTCGGLLVVAAVLLGVAAVAAWFGMLWLSNPEKAEMTSDLINIAIAVEKYRDENHYLPASLGLLSLQESTLKDPWGQPYRYDLIDPKGEFDLVSSGVDKQFDTADDVKLSKLGEAWSPAAHIQIDGVSGKGGLVKVEADQNKIEVGGDERGRKVRIKIGDRVIEVQGDAAGGNVANAPAGPPDESTSAPAPDAPHPSEPPG